MLSRERKKNALSLKCSTSLDIKEMKNTNLRLHLTPVRMAAIQKTKLAENGKDVEKQDPLLLARD